MSKIGKISGFPELLPEQKLAEDIVIGGIKAVYANWGFTPIETAAVEQLSTLASKGVVDKELYVLRRAKAGEDDEAELALRFDLSVPFARYVAQNFASLNFPFKRYQVQKVWRGDRPQKGRFREFYQFDIDTIAQDELPLSCDAEILAAFCEAWQRIPVGQIRIRLSNRKLLQGFFESLGLDAAQREKARIAIDKLDKIKEEGVAKELSTGLGLAPAMIEQILAFSRNRFPANEIEQRLAALGIVGEMFAAGCAETITLMKLIPVSAREVIEIDLSLARGLDYYTGVVFEVQLPEHPEFGSAGGGGRYEDLASAFVNRKLPGVGASIGLSRVMDLLLSKGLIPTPKRTTARVLVVVFNEEQRAACNELAQQFRAGGVATEVYFKSPKLGKQIDYAAGKGMEYVAFLNSETGAIEVKNLATKEQTTVSSVAQWCAGNR